MQNGIPLTDEMQLQLAELYGGLDEWGAPIMDPHYSAAWAWAGNTPFQWGKQVGSHLGGTRNPLVVHWPDRVGDAGGLRSQFTHVIDIAPTILDVAGIPAARHRRRDRAGADARHDVRAVADRRRRSRAPHPAVLRDHRQPRHVQGRLVARDEDRADPLGAHPRGARALRAGRLGSRRRPRRALLPARRLHPGPRPGRRAPREGRGAQGAVLGGGRALQGPAAARRAVDVLRHAAADPRGDDVRVPRRRPERDAGDDPADLQPLVLDHRPTSSSPRAGPRASSSPMPTTSAGSPSTSRTASSPTPTR